MFKTIKYSPIALPLLLYSWKKQIVQPTQLTINENLINQKINVSQKKVVNAILIGPTGAGKSYIGNILLGRYGFPQGSSHEDRTKDFNEQQSTVILDNTEYSINITDSIGFFDDEIGCKSILDQFIVLMKCFKDFNKIIFVYPYKIRNLSFEKYLLGALSFCINSTSSTLLVVINQVEDTHVINNSTGKYEYNEEIKKANIRNMKDTVNHYWTKNAIFYEMKRSIPTEIDYEKTRSRQQKELLDRIVDNPILDKRSFRKWDEFYDMHQNNQVSYHLERIETLEKQLVEYQKKQQSNNKKIDIIQNLLSDTTTIIVPILPMNPNYIPIVEGTLKLLIKQLDLFKQYEQFDQNDLIYHRNQVEEIKLQGYPQDPLYDQRIQEINKFLAVH